MKKIVLMALLASAQFAVCFTSCKASSEKPVASETVSPTVDSVSADSVSAETRPAVKAQVSKSDRALVESMLAKAASQKKSTAGEWMLYFGKQLANIPYIGGTLDRGSEEELIVNLHELDCTTYVEQVAALTMCAQRGEKSFDDFCEHLRHIRYINGDIEYAKRQHYFTVWIDDNVKEDIVTDIQGPNPPFSAVQTVNVNWMTTHQSSYKMLSAHPEWVAGIRELEQSVNGRKWRYIPKDKIYNTALMRQTIHDGDIIVILTNKKGLDTTHIGMASWHADGLHLLNASAIHKKVIDEPMTLRTYMSKHPVQIGIRVCRMK